MEGSAGSTAPSVLLLHNSYRNKGGEERSLADMSALLRSRGHHVAVEERDSEAELAGLRGRVKAGSAIVLGGSAPRRVSDAVRSNRADIVHVHNMLPLFGPRALKAARRAGARVVMSLHNYRLVCAIGIGYRDGTHCELCKGRNTWPGLQHNCRGNVPEAAAYAIGLASHQRGTFESVDRFIVPSHGALAHLTQLGLPKEKSEVIPHFLPPSAFAERSRAGEGSYALIAGRLTEEKGFDTAIESAARAKVPLRIAGTGTDEARLHRIVDRVAPNGDIRFLGKVSVEEVAGLLAGAAFAVLPSRWHELHPYAAAEATAAGVPVLGSRMGGLPEILGEESVLPPHDLEAWATAMAEMWNDPALRQQRGEQALLRSRHLHDVDRYYERLMACYQAALLPEPPW
jgi:glycosyltransferase involved in cell wall biosynthesis